ncbi:MAG: hypothetical protein JSU65_00500 [Candidatus Zixiibacteriota bacterium]|nr:MAG: hypothetical protein JSU65_00500 [candidate division Zixibacteria bacterium]
MLSLRSCSVSSEKIVLPPQSTENVALADSLRAVFQEVRVAMIDGRPEEFLALLDQEEIPELKRLARKHGFRSLKTYLGSRYANWPDLDTLRYGGLVTSPGYARLTLVGTGESFGQTRERLRYTVLLFRYQADGWKLAATATFDLDRYDPYGHEITYHETDLPPKLRFPRQF